ncbi:glycosyl hydrolase family 28-related protein [Rhizomicrobium electricum]|uniref:Pectate lyase superfamily protein domain-containing protein n=1 Tax=Rhizomicrobium electricum TaxID=480070 RepID=A0ABN1EIY2_9PROT|nr:glycosyl hydrolase family 28-related protein [Rhizomicrobium electricum]NIJ48298.1 hypothetical protein [Rhizomicrobium electricum]
MNRRELLISTAAFAAASPAFAAVRPTRPVGADTAWTTYQAEAMKTSGTVMGPAYSPFRVENEASNGTCVKLGSGQSVEFTVTTPANALVVRFSLPDAPDGSGTSDILTLKRNGEKIADIALSSRFAWVYGTYPFTNNPADGKPRHFYDEVRLKDVPFAKGDVVTLTKAGDAPYCILDLVDLEQVAPPLPRPADALSLADFGADGKGERDATEAVRALLAAAAKDKKIAYVPPGIYKLTGDIEIPSNVTLQGAGMWHTTFVGDEALYPQANRRLRFKLSGENSKLSDFALDGRLKYRNDSEQNDGIFGAHGRNCTVSRLWIEHTKVGLWFYVCRGIRVEGCRMRNLFADGINLCVDTSDCVVENCTTRNTGDDCFAIWPAPSDQGFTQESAAPGNNVIRRCTGELPSLAQGASIYGGANNRIEDCLFTDIASGCGILISTTFETSNEKIDNNFRGTTVVENCVLKRCGGYDHGWTWRAALQIALHRKSISGLRIRDVRIEDSLSDGFGVIVPPDIKDARTLTDTTLDHVAITGSGVAVPEARNVRIGTTASGRIDAKACRLGRIENGSTTFRIVNAA